MSEFESCVISHNTKLPCVDDSAVFIDFGREHSPTYSFDDLMVGSNTYYLLGWRLLSTDIKKRVNLKFVLD